MGRTKILSWIRNDNKMAEAAAAGAAAEKESKKQQPLYPVRFVWDHGGDDVSVVITAAAGGGDVRTVKLRRQRPFYHEELIALNLGRYEYRWAPVTGQVVEGSWQIAKEEVSGPMDPQRVG